MRELGIDIETYSGHDLTKCGVYRYVEHPDFAILLFAYSVDGGAVKVIDLAQGETVPEDVLSALTDAGVTKTAYNATFERTCLGKWLGQRLDPSQWRCTMARAARMGLPLGLGKCGEALNLAQGKMREGAALIRYFSLPDRNGKRRYPSASWDRWETFKAYCQRDVEVEQQILAKVKRLEVPEWEDALYDCDQRINDRGVLIDRVFVEHAARMDEEFKEGLRAQARALTGLENPDSPAQLKDWLKRITGVSIDTLNKKSLDELEDNFKGYYPRAVEMLKLRRLLGKTSNKKYPAMLDCVCDDGRIHGLLQYYGAARTGRWAGRLVQVQNLPQNHLPDIDNARRLVKGGDLDEMELEYSNVSQVLSELIRTAFVAKEGHTFHVCDFSAIEARVIAWLAGEKWVLDVFRGGGDIYCATASQMFGVPVEKHGQNAELRQKGKVAVLALGYGGGVSALEAMGGKRLGLTEDEEKDIVRLWRRANKHIVRLWQVIEDACLCAMKTGEEVTFNRGMKVEYKWGCLIITLPSGRPLVYPRAKVGTETDWRGDHDSIEYEGTNQTTGKWETVRTYGGKLTENVVQGIARDILAWVIMRADRAGMETVFHIHDEIVVEADPNKTTLQDVERLFDTPVEWCPDLPLKGAGYSTPYYLKD